MKRCMRCEGEKLVASETELSRKLAGRTFKVAVPARRCAGCGEQYISQKAGVSGELAIAEKLAQAGVVAGDAFQLRKALALPAVELAALMDVTPETMSRWEHGKLPVERRAIALLSAMVLDRVEGRTMTLDRLQALQKPSRLPKLVRLVPRLA
jgi:putative zinc finger/helix-turn-helix YgiT family protein